MSVRTLEGAYDGGTSRACLVDSVTETAFGPLFADGEQVDSFLSYLREYGYADPRTLTDAQLDDAHTRWLDAWYDTHEPPDDDDEDETCADCGGPLPCTTPGCAEPEGLEADSDSTLGLRGDRGVP